MLTLRYNFGENQVFKAKIFHNKVLGFGREFLDQYLTYFSTKYLFIDGWADSRYAVPESGPFLISNTLLAVVGLWIARNTEFRRKNSWWFLLIFLLLAPVPAALAFVESPNLRRSLLMVAPASLILGFGLYSFLKKQFKYPLFKLGLIAVVLVEFSFFWFQYSHHVDAWTAHERSDGYVQLGKFLASADKLGAQHWVSGKRTVPIYYLFYDGNFNPTLAELFSPGLKIDKVGNVNFFDADCSAEIDLQKLGLAGGDFVYESQACQYDKNTFRLVDTITGVKPKLGFNRLIVDRPRF